MFSQSSPIDLHRAMYIDLLRYMFAGFNTNVSSVVSTDIYTDLYIEGGLAHMVKNFICFLPGL